jgi:hypothetical protein
MACPAEINPSSVSWSWHRFIERIAGRGMINPAEIYPRCIARMLCCAPAIDTRRVSRDYAARLRV